MKRMLTAFASLLALMVAASAADLPTRKEPMAPPPPMVLPWTWTGVYGGLNIGTGWGYGSATAFDNATGAVLGTATSNTGGAFRGGGQVGYLYQFPGNFVIGGQFNVEGIQGRTRTNQVFGITTSDRVALGLTGQLGYAFGDFLPFIQGGWVGGTENIRVTDVVGNRSVTASVSNGGWTFGGGIDYHLFGGWFVSAQYQYTWQNNYNVNFPAAGFNVRANGNSQAVYLGANYKF